VRQTECFVTKLHDRVESQDDVLLELVGIMDELNDETHALREAVKRLIELLELLAKEVEEDAGEG